jgi:hypothetical protein
VEQAAAGIRGPGAVTPGPAAGAAGAAGDTLLAGTAHSGKVQLDVRGPNRALQIRRDHLLRAAHKGEAVFARFGQRAADGSLGAG